MSEKDYQVVKLSNGENLICDVLSDSDTTLLVESPLKMETLSKFTRSGVCLLYTSPSPRDSNLSRMPSSA